MQEEGGFTKPFGKTLQIIFKRPFIIVFFGILALGYCAVDSFNPTGILLKYGTLSSGDIFGSIVFLLQFLLKLIISPKGIAFIAAFLLAAAFIIGFVFSGYFYAVNNALEGRPKVKGEFAEGFKKHFGRIFAMSFLFLLLSFVFAMFIIIAAVPAMVVTNAAFAGKPGLTLTAFLVDLVTLIVLFFSFMFYRIYMSFWYPAAISVGIRAFSVGKRTADSFFWNLVKRFFAIDIIFILFQILSVGIGSSYPALAIKWVFYTLFFAFVVTYVFTLFRFITLRNNKRNNANEKGA